MKQGLKLAGRALATYFLMLILSLLILPGIGGDWYWAQIVLNVLMLGVMALLMYADGGTQGEHAATISATAERMRAEGRPVEDLKAKCFTRRAALVCYLVILTPFLLVACVNLIAEPYYPPVIIEQSDYDLDAALDAPMQTEVQIDPKTDIQAEGQIAIPQGAENSTETSEAEQSINPFNVAARAVFMTTLSIYSLLGQNPHGLNLLFILFALLIPLPETLGYLAGPKLRQKKLIAIEKGKRRKMRNLKMNKRQPKPREPKHEV